MLNGKLSHCMKVGYISATMGSLSLFATICVPLFYFFIKSLRNFTYRLVVYLQVADSLLSIGIILIALENFQITSSESFCLAQSLIFNFGVLSTCLWTFLISFVMVSSLKCCFQKLKSMEKYYLLVGYGLPLILTIMYAIYLLFPSG